ncbi:TetR/AcrR family transcriptional regulator [Neobacillus cucumis]|uniref:TetR/AcrR family transcriptional regulator n=1 Tax=Neobacillus cucumis TaxID=1740721 RepID=UPI0019646919|nr:TetR/AcrR family transcriptional regulator [Neobacillus cucumis]MBM7653395.1 AcrR family transcriptional regulator [Neobacillus cucumis]
MSSNKRRLLLDAASNIVKNEGVAQLTLEAVAKNAGVSKGGLLYHFPNKEALISGMIDELTNNYANEIQEKVNVDNYPNGKWSRAYVEATFTELDDGLKMSSGLLAAAFTNPELLEKLKTQYVNWQKNIENDKTDPVLATIARLAADGLWFAEIFGLAPLDNELKERIFNQLVSWTKEEKN